MPDRWEVAWGSSSQTRWLPVLGVSRRTAEVRIDDALALTQRLPRTLMALEVGLVSMSVARVVVRETENTTPSVAAEVEARVLDRLGRGIVQGLGRLSVDELSLLGRLDPELAAAVSVRATRGGGAGLGSSGSDLVGRGGHEGTAGPRPG